MTDTSDHIRHLTVLASNSPRETREALEAAVEALRAPRIETCGQCGFFGLYVVGDHRPVCNNPTPSVVVGIVNPAEPPPARCPLRPKK